MHNCITIAPRNANFRLLMAGLAWIALLGLVLLPCLRVFPDGYVGWITYPPVRYAEPRYRPARRGPRPWTGWRHFQGRAAWHHARHSFPAVGWQLWGLVVLSAPLGVGVSPEGVSVHGAAWCLLGLPVLRWLLAISGVA